MDKRENCLQIKEVTKWYPDRGLTADRVSLAVQRGDRVLIYGKTDATKVFFRLAAGTEETDEGTVRWFCDRAFVPEEFPELENMCVLDYMLLSLNMRGVVGKTAKRKCVEYLEHSLLREKKTLSAAKLGGYEKALLLLYMAVIHSPGILVIGNCGKWMTWEQKKTFWETVRAYTDREKTAVLCLADDRELPYDFIDKYRLSNGILKEDDYIG